MRRRSWVDFRLINLPLRDKLPLVVHTELKQIADLGRCQLSIRDEDVKRRGSFCGRSRYHRLFSSAGLKIINLFLSQPPQKNKSSRRKAANTCAVRQPDRRVYIISLRGQPEHTPSFNFHDSLSERGKAKKENQSTRSKRQRQGRPTLSHNRWTRLIHNTS